MILGLSLANDRRILLGRDLRRGASAVGVCSMRPELVAAGAAGSAATANEYTATWIVRL